MILAVFFSLVSAFAQEFVSPDQLVKKSEDFYKIEENTKNLSSFIMSFRFEGSADLVDIASVAAIEIMTAWKLETWWPVLSLQKSRVDKFSDSETKKNDLLTVGLGLGLRGFIIAELLDSNRWFEFLNAQLTYNSYDDSFDEKTYTGFGLKAQYGLHYLVGQKLHLGGFLSYNFADVTRQNTGLGQSKDERSQMIDWMGVGLDLAFHF